MRLSKSIFSKKNSVFGTKSRFIRAFLKLKFRFFKCFVSKSVFGAGQSIALTGGAGPRNRFFLPGAGAEKKISGAGAEEKWLGSATLVM